MGIYILKPEITGKQFKKTSGKHGKQQSSESQKNTENRNIGYMWVQFLHLAWLEGGSYPFSPSCILLL